MRPVVDVSIAKCWTTRGSSQGESSTTSPLFHGLQQYLVSRSDVLPRVLEHANDMLPNLTALLDASDRPFPSSAEGPAPTTDVTLVFDAAGSGKTRFLRDKVLETGGFYFVAPNVPCMRPPVPPKDQLNDDRSSSGSDGSVTLSTRGNSRRQADPLNQLLLGETRGHASRDTYTLYQDLSFLEDVGITGGRRAAAGRQQDSLVDMKLCVEPLLRARRYMLDNMPSYQKSPIRWLQLQIVTSPPGGEDDSSALDVSDIALRFFRLSPRWGGSQSVHSLDDGELSNISASVPICFDEVQALKDNSLAERMFQSMIECHTGHAYVATTSLDVPLAKTRGRSSKSSSSTKSSTTKYMSSSRTNVSNPDTFWSVLSHHAWSIASEMFELQSQQPSVPDITRSSRQYCSPDQQRVDHYPLLTRDGQPLGFLVDMMAAVFPLDSSRPLSTGDTWAAVERELLTNWTIFSADIRDETITRECTRYFGRVRWAATFTEELLRASASSVTQSSRTGSGMIGKLSPADVLAASTRTSDRIKAAIKRQIHAIRDTGCLHEFLTTAVEADTLGVPREFVGEIAAKLVAAGLALVYEGEAGSARSSLVSERGDGTVDSASVRQVRARLSEPIVLEAAIEYIRDCAVSYSAQRGSLDAMSRRLIAGPLSVGGVSGLTGKNVSENAIAAVSLSSSFNH